MAQAVQVDFLVSGQVDSSGNRLDSGTVTFYETDGTTLKTVWEDGAKATAASNPYTLSAAGTAQVFADGIYIVVVKTSGGTTVRTVTNAYFNPNDTTADVGYIDASDYGSGDDANAISLAITAAAGSDQTVLLKPKNWDIDANLTIPTNINLKPLEGAYCTVAASKTLTVSGTIEAPLYNIFRGSGTVTIDDRNIDIPSIWLINGSHDNASHYGLRTYLNGIKVTAEDSTLPGHFQANDDGVNKEVFRFDRISASPADNDTNDISFYSENDNNQQVSFGKLQYKMLDVSDGTEKGELSLWVADGADGSVDQMFVLDIDGAQIKGNLTLYDAVNDANPTVFLGSATAEKLSVQSVYDSEAQTLDYVEFNTFAASATADKGEYRFKVDETLVATIDDGGLELKASGSLSFGAVDILTDSTGTTTLNNIDALDATTEATIEDAIDTLSNLTSVGTLTTLTTSGAINSQTISSSANFTGSLTTAGIVSVDDTTDSTSGTTGSIHTDGGLGVAKDVVVGGDLFTVAWTDYFGSSTITGWAASPTGQIRYKRVGNLVFVSFLITGTSNATNASFTIPITSANTTVEFGGSMEVTQDNGSTQTISARVNLAPNSTTVTLFSDMGSGSWTASGTKLCRGSVWYEAA
jgi:hypothetical protein